jgi:hypothetical protein
MNFDSEHRTFAAIAASFTAATTASATPVTSPTISTTEQAPAIDGNNFQAADESGDLMNFTLKRVGVDGPMFADHQSHASHASHRSHVSGS